MKVVLVLDIESIRSDVIIDREKPGVMVSLRNLLLDQYDSNEYIVTTVPEFYT